MFAHFPGIAGIGLNVGVLVGYFQLQGGLRGIVIGQYGQHTRAFL